MGCDHCALLFKTHTELSYCLWGCQWFTLCSGSSSNIPNTFNRIEVRRPHEPIHVNIPLRKKSTMWILCGFALSSIDMKPGLQHPGTTSHVLQGHNFYNDVIDSTSIKDEQRCTTAQNYVIPDKDSFATKSASLFIVGGMMTSFKFFPDENSAIITLYGEWSLKRTCPHSCMSKSGVFGFATTGHLCWIQWKEDTWLDAEHYGSGLWNPYEVVSRAVELVEKR